MCYSQVMKKNQSSFDNLKRFFLNAFLNAEISRTEVDNFFQDYLKFIFELNHLDIKKYDISISKVEINEYHSKREKTYKCAANKESRNLIKRKVLTKPSFKSNSGNHYFDAMMCCHPTVPNKFDIVINKNLCNARNDDEILNLVQLLYVFGHEVHHIIQYIKRPTEMERYDYLQELHYAYLKSANEVVSNPREVRKLQRAINQHLHVMYSHCKPEEFANKKAYDYLDILFNQIIASLPPVNSIEEDMFLTFIETLKDKNYQSYLCTGYDALLTDLKYGDSLERLINFPVESDLLNIN